MADSDTLQALNPNVVFYSDSFITARDTVDRLEGIKNMLASLDIGTGREDDIVDARMHFWQRWVDSIINSKLASVFKTPLRRITRTGRHLNKTGTAVPFFPDPIPLIATKMVAAQLIWNEYTDIDPNVNEEATVIWQEAMDLLEEIGAYNGQVGTTFLEGQDSGARSPFVPPGVMPRSIPGAPRLG